MNRDDFGDAMGKIDESIITMTDKKRNRRKKRTVIKICAVAACVALIIGVAFSAPNFPDSSDFNIISAGKVKAIEAEYPKMTQFPSNYDDETQSQYDKWYSELSERRAIKTEKPDALRSFYEKTLNEFLLEEREVNVTYSPLNIYIALAMLAETSDGNTREEILTLLGVENLSELRKVVFAAWNANYCDDGTVKSVLANSLWLNNSVKYNTETLNILKDNYYASSFAGDPSDSAFSERMRIWINEQTGGLLKKQTEDLSLDPETVFALVSTVYFKAKWDKTFSESNTKEQVFHTPRGDKTCDFMNGTDMGTVYFGSDFIAVCKPFENSGNMWFFLPNEGKTTDDVIKSAELLDAVLDSDNFEDSRNMTVNISVPKFDVTSEIDLKNALRNLGVVDAFDVTRADFSPITDETPLFVSDAEHTCRVKIDEEGCEAAAFTVFKGDGTSISPEEIDFVLDRPFVYVVTGLTGMPMFAGVVNNP